jgi:hypothetical protein
LPSFSAESKLVCDRIRNGGMDPIVPIDQADTAPPALR